MTPPLKHAAVALALATSAAVAQTRPATSQATMNDTWIDVAAQPDPTAALLAQFRTDAASAAPLAPTGLVRADYLKLIAGNVDFWKQYQNGDGAIIDPYRQEEWQYSTPCFAAAAATLAANAGRNDLVEPAARAMDRACDRLAARQAATSHEDFYGPPIAHAMPLLKPFVGSARFARWTVALASIDPDKTYRQPIGGNNWNVVALAGEYLLHVQGVRASLDYVERSIASQGKFFRHPYGLYTEGPMPYDAFPRLWLDDMMAAGYDGPFAERLRDRLRRAAVTSLFMQSPIGEQPTGGRSAQHQWNEAEQCVTFECHAAIAKAAGDAQLAGAFKRAARLSLASIRRWQRPSGELWIVKNRADPADAHGFETYSGHSQYNLLAMAMLAIAYEHASATDDVAEAAAPADVGGFVLDLRERFGKVIANAGGTYVEIETAADAKHNPTGLLRVHRRGLLAPIGPSDGISARTVERYPTKPDASVAVGPAWRLADGSWQRLASLDAKAVPDVRLIVDAATTQRASFAIEYRGDLGGPSAVRERYELTSGGVAIAATVDGHAGPIRMIWPVLANDGAADATIDCAGDRVRVTLGDASQAFVAAGADAVRVEPARVASRNGWARLAVAEFTKPTATLRIEPAGDAR